ncbi:uncharacterized protein A1O9_03992 [Exophiala aquamarina CBS 119918]|uniref:Glucosidase 2 subunit beta n=1 Tax=Exophiala aquamarina CBS 119918 TaxID=1182545 RepID=A0A072PIK0_9EURO|nr:uncharacterized protein A1O9_03992 [Exophiala aquamarina CBS 119918]KEF59148.1 hypothetical protein A1O9_03992 [Exophiala aquamarina CBS 119918]
MILRSEFLFLASYLSTPAWAAETRASSSSRPRGVSPEWPDTPAASVNSTLALPGFYCKNKGHQPSYIRFESVNDGKCDYDLCCDGSDEWAQVGGNKCLDKCKEIGTEFRKNQEVKQKALKAALKRKSALAAEASRLKREVELSVETAELKLKGFQLKATEAEDTLKDVERREKLRIVRGEAAGQGGGKLAVLIGLARSRVEELRGHLETTKKQRDAMVGRVTELEKLLAALKDEHNPNFNDEGVKRAVRGWEDYAARDTDDSWTDAEDRDLFAVMAIDSDANGINWNEFQEEPTEPESDVAALYQFRSYLPDNVRLWIDEKSASIRQILVQNGVLPDTASPSAGATASESKAVQDAKKLLSDAERDVKNAENDLKRHREDLQKDYGPYDGIFRALKDVCISKDSGEYEYELCFLAQTKQKSKKGGSHTTMGNFVGFDTEFVDEGAIPADGKGLGTGERLIMKYENGQGCWNGPSRSTRVYLACSETDEVWKISESEKCVYRMEVGTAAVCEQSPDGNTLGYSKVLVEDDGVEAAAVGKKDEL